MDSFALNVYQLLHGAKSDIRWIQEVYPSAIVFLILIPFFVAAAYYFLLVLISPWWRGKLAWALTLLTTAIITASVALTRANKYLHDTPFNEEFVSFWFINFLYALILFFLFSMGLKFASVHAKKTPF